MARRSPGSTDAWNGSVSGSVYGSDYTVGTFPNDEDLDDNLLHQDENSMQDTQVFGGNQSRQETQFYGDDQSSQESAWADKDYYVPTGPPLRGTMRRFIKDSDPREEFRLRAQQVKETGRAEREESITLSESRERSSDEIGRGNTVKKINRGLAKNVGRKRNDEDESKSESSPMKKRKQAKNGTRKTGKECD